LAEAAAIIGGDDGRSLAPRFLSFFSFAGLNGKRRLSKDRHEFIDDMIDRSLNADVELERPEFSQVPAARAPTGKMRSPNSSSFRSWASLTTKNL